MAPPINMNVILSQTPTVEKILQAEQKNPDQIQQQAHIQEGEEHRLKRETVQNTPDTKGTRPVDEESEEKKKQRQKQSAGQIGEEEVTGLEEAGSAMGNIVDIII